MKSPVRHKDLGVKSSPSRRIYVDALIHDRESVCFLTDLASLPHPATNSMKNILGNYRRRIIKNPTQGRVF